MSRVLTFSRQFPSFHPRNGEPTGFVERLYLSWGVSGDYYDNLPKERDNFFSMDDTEDGKCHTIRAGNRWKVGDKFSPRVWSGKPYQSKQIIIAPDITVIKTWNFEICNVGTNKDKDNIISINDHRLGAQEVQTLAKNDGLSFMDFLNWFRFPRPFTGQIICWDESIDY